MSSKETKTVTEAAEKAVEEVRTDAKPEAAGSVKEEKPAAEKKAEKESAKTVKKPAARKAASKKADKTELKPEVFIEYQGQQAGETSVIEKVRAAFVASGHRASSIKSLQIYMKPEEFKAYYVINDGKYTGDVNLF